MKYDVFKDDFRGAPQPAENLFHFVICSLHIITPFVAGPGRSSPIETQDDEAVPQAYREWYRRAIRFDFIRPAARRRVVERRASKTCCFSACCSHALRLSRRRCCARTHMFSNTVMHGLLGSSVQQYHALHNQRILTSWSVQRAAALLFSMLHCVRVWA